MEPFIRFGGWLLIGTPALLILKTLVGHMKPGANLKLFLQLRRDAVNDNFEE